MASLSEIRTAARTTITTAIPSLFGYDTVPDSVNLPAVVVMPSDSDFLVAMGRGADTWQLDIIVIVSAAEPNIGQNALDTYVTGAGANSIRQAIFQNRTLGLADVNAHIAGMSGYNLQFSILQLDHIAATLRMVVHTNGRA